MKRSLSVLGLVALLLFAGCKDKHKPEEGQTKKSTKQTEKKSTPEKANTPKQEEKKNQQPKQDSKEQPSQKPKGQPTQPPKEQPTPTPENEQKDQPTPKEQPKKSETPKTLTLETTKATIDLDKGASTTIKITSGNGNYKYGISENAKDKLTVNLSGELITITTTSSDKLTAEVTITDITTEKNLTVTITVLPKSIPHHPLLKAVISKVEFNKKTEKEQKEMIDKLINDTEALSTLINGVKGYSKDQYATQASLFDDGKQTYTWRKNTYEQYKKGTPLPEDFTLEYIYSEIEIYGFGYFTVEYLARKAEQFKEQYPNNNSIKEIVNKIFNSGNYGSQQGNEFVQGANKEAIVPYNSIVDIVNSIERGKANK